VEPDPLQLRLDFHQESVVLHDYAEGRTTVRLVSALDVAHALASELDLTTGLLPRDALWWARTSTGTRVAVWREPAVWTVRLRERPDHLEREVAHALAAPRHWLRSRSPVKNRSIAV